MISKKLFTICTIFFAFFLYLSCNQNADKNSSSNTGKKEVNGAQIYKQYCIACHGVDGQLRLNGAANLSDSKLSREARINVITNGRGMMTPYRKILTQKEVGAVADYILSFRR